MSTDAFAPVAFPRLDAPADAAERAAARRRGFSEGHAEGYRAGLAAAQEEQRRADEDRRAREAAAAAQVASALEALDAARAALDDRARELTAAAEEHVLRCAVELAELLVAGDLADGGTAAAVAVRRALLAADPDDIRTVRLHPADLHALGDAVTTLAGIALVADDAVGRGGAVVTLDHGFVDARLASALDRARRALDGDPT